MTLALCLCAALSTGRFAQAEADAAGFGRGRMASVHGELVLRADRYAKRADTRGGAATVRLTGEAPFMGGRLVGRADLSRTWLDSRAHDEAIVREFVWSRRFNDRWQLSAGRLMPVHGRADGFRVLDALTPVDWPDGLFETTENSRRGLWSAQLEYEFDDNELSIWLSADRGLDRFMPPGPDLPSPPARASGIGRGSVAMTWKARLGSVDLTTLAYHGVWREALALPKPSGLEWGARRASMLGGSFDVPLGGLVLRGEASRMRYEARAGDDGLPLARALLGVDLLRGSVMFSPQLFAEHGSRYPGDKRRWRSSLSMLIDARLLQDRLGIRYFAVRAERGAGRWHSLRLTWSTVGQQQWRFKLDRLSGTPSDGLGVFGERSRAAVEWSVPF